jgi:hypothetical protein
MNIGLMMPRSVARLGDTDKTIAKATEDSIEVKEGKAFEATTKSEGVMIETDNGSKFITTFKYFEQRVYPSIALFLNCCTNLKLATSLSDLEEINGDTVTIFRESRSQLVIMELMVVRVKVL